MSYFDTYKKRLLAAGSTPDEVMINNTKTVINNAFDSSLFSIKVPIDGIDKDVIINQGRTSLEKTILLKPDDSIDKGSLVNIDGQFYLVVDFDTNKVYPIAKTKMCNTTLKLSFGSERTLARDSEGKIITDDYGRPEYIYEESTKDEPCIVEMKNFKLTDTEKLLVPEDSVLIMIKYQDADNLKVNSTIVLYDDEFKITHIDKTQVINNKGLLLITAENIADKAVSG